MADLNGSRQSIDSIRGPVHSSLPLKYYIHDSVPGLRFQLIGALTEADIAELAGCWNTARTILGNRQLVMDLRALESADEAGKQWLLSLAHEGAQYLPESYFRSGLAPQEYVGPSRKPGFFSRLVLAFRGRPIPVESSTRAQ